MGFVESIKIRSLSEQIVAVLQRLACGEKDLCRELRVSRQKRSRNPISEMLIEKMKTE